MIQIIHHCKSLPCPKKLLLDTAQDVYAREGLDTDAGVTIVLCSDYIIRKHNLKYRNKDKITDVLSFRFGDPDLLGEVYISLKRAKIQASKYGVTYKAELKRLLVHGLLHLAGYDHEKDEDREVMEERESMYL